MVNICKPQDNPSPPPINWTTKPRQSSANPKTTARRLVPVFIDADRLGDLQEALRDEPAPRQPNADFQDYAVIDVHILENILRRLSQLESNSRHSQSECDPLSEPQDLSSADVTSALSCLSMSTSSIDARAAAVTQMSTNPFQSPSLAARPSPISTPARIISPASSPRKKRYYVVLVGKCAGIFYDDW